MIASLSQILSIAGLLGADINMMSVFNVLVHLGNDVLCNF